MNNVEGREGYEDYASVRSPMRIDLVAEPRGAGKHMLVTIVGFSPHESGKTRLAARLAKSLREKGFRLSAVKPVGGHSAWEQHFSLRYALDYGVLVGGDAIRLARATGAEPHIIEPVDMLLAPPDVDKFLTRLRDYLILLESLEAQVVLLRVNTCSSGEKPEPLHMLVEDNVEALAPGVRRLIEDIASSLRPKPLMITSSRFRELVSSGNLVTAADICTSKLVVNADIAIIESYNDVLIPIPIATRSKLFIAVGPGRAVVYEGSLVVKAASLYASLRYGTTRTTDVLHLVKPLTSIPLDFVYDDETPGRDVEKLTDLIESHMTSSS